MRRAQAIGRFAVSLAAVAAITVTYFTFIQVNPTTVAMTYLVAILLIASWWGLFEATVASVAAVICFNFFFLPPTLQLTIADPQNWVAFVSFIITAIVASQLSGRARQRDLDAASRQRDLERLYALSRGLLLSEHGNSAPSNIARHIADAFEVETVGLYDRRTDRVAWVGAREMPSIEGKLREVARTGASLRESPNIIMMAIQLGGTPIGSVAMTDVGLSDTVLRSIANLAAIGLERARADEATARAEAARTSSELRATVLDALAHEFKTPLTSMKAASSDLLASPSSSPHDRELVSIIDEDLDRFQSLVTDAVQMLRIDAGDFAMHPGRHQLMPVIAAILHRFDAHLDGHHVVQRVPEQLYVNADIDLLTLALRQLIDNALKYSPPTSTIDVQAAANGTVDITVRNSGSVIPEAEQARIFERFYRGSLSRQIPGTGMGLAIVQQIARAHGGTLTLSSSPKEGTAFTLSLPRDGANA
jgi:two-component system, OmpR family, sensor histidine kinase KdpD